MAKLYRDVVLTTRSGEVRREIIREYSTAVMLSSLIQKYRGITIQIDITPDPDYSDRRMMYEGYRGGYSWWKAKEIFEKLEEDEYYLHR